MSQPPRSAQGPNLALRLFFVVLVAAGLFAIVWKQSF